MIPSHITVGRPAPGIRFPTIPPVQSGDLVNSLRWSVASRLVIEGGFDPDWIRPRPPITVDRDRDGLFLSHDPDAARPDRQTVPGGLKEAKPDVTVAIPNIGPVLAVSLEGTESGETGPGGVPELTGGLERIAGACVNLHMVYPALVYGFWHVISANRVQDLARVGGLDYHCDHSLRRNGESVAELQRYHDALARLSERGGIRDAPSRYEACALTLVDRGAGPLQGTPYPDYPPPGSILDYNRVFRRLYEIYDRRYVDSTLSPKAEDRAASLASRLAVDGLGHPLWITCSRKRSPGWKGDQVRSTQPVLTEQPARVDCAASAPCPDSRARTNQVGSASRRFGPREHRSITRRTASGRFPT